MGHDAAFSEWISELRYVAGLVFPNFTLHPEHWRDDFDRGRTPAEAFERILAMVAASKARRRLQ